MDMKHVSIAGTWTGILIVSDSLSTLNVLLPSIFLGWEWVGRGIGDDDWEMIAVAQAWLRGSLGDWGEVQTIFPI